jgi:hypothetical protein
MKRPLSLRGVTLLRTEWCRRLGGSHDLVSRRLKLGWPLEEALAIPAGQKRRPPSGFAR